jgi:hypothetical protein
MTEHEQDRVVGVLLRAAEGARGAREGVGA